MEVSDLSPGAHTITAMARDAAAEEGSATVALTVVGAPAATPSPTPPTTPLPCLGALAPGLVGALGAFLAWRRHGVRWRP